MLFLSKPEKMLPQDETERKNNLVDQAEDPSPQHRVKASQQSLVTPHQFLNALHSPAYVALFPHSTLFPRMQFLPVLQK